MEAPKHVCMSRFPTVQIERCSRNARWRLEDCWKDGSHIAGAGSTPGEGDERIVRHTQVNVSVRHYAQNI